MFASVHYSNLRERRQIGVHGFVFSNGISDFLRTNLEGFDFLLRILVSVSGYFFEAFSTTVLNFPLIVQDLFD